MNDYYYARNQLIIVYEENRETCDCCNIAHIIIIHYNKTE